MKKKIIIIIVIVLVLAGGAAAFFLLSNVEKEPVITYYVPGEYFVTNIKDSTRLLKANIVLELTTDTAQEYLTENNHIIRDVIVFTLREQTEPELRSSVIHDKLCKTIVDELKERLNIDYLQTIYFNDYVIQ